MKSRSISGMLFDALNHMVLLLLVLTMILPFLYILSYSISDPTEVAGGVILYPRGFSLESYQIMFTNSAILKGMLVSVARTVIGPILMIFVTAMAAYCLSRDDLIGVKWFRKLFVFTMYISVGLIPIYILNVELHLTGTFWIYVVPAAIDVFNMILIKTFIESLPKSLEEAALIDGANEFYLFWKVLFPVCFPVIAAVTLFSAVSHWNNFIDTQIYNSMKPGLFTLQYDLYQTIASQANAKSATFNGARSKITPQSLKMAITIITVVPIMCVYPFLQRFFIKGLLIGSVKG